MLNENEDYYIAICTGTVLWDKEEDYVANLKYVEALAEFKAHFK